MAKYLNPEVLKELDEYRKRIFADREAIYKKHKIDVLDTDTLSSLSVYEIVIQYDQDYNINFARNGEDAISNNVKIEQKFPLSSSRYATFVFISCVSYLSHCRPSS